MMAVFDDIERSMQAIVEHFRAGENAAAQTLVATLPDLVTRASKETAVDAATQTRIVALSAQCLEESLAAKKRIGSALENIRKGQRARSLYRKRSAR